MDHATQLKQNEDDIKPEVIVKVLGFQRIIKFYTFLTTISH